MGYLFADCLIDISHEKIDRPFQYIIPENLQEKIKCGDCVEVPFGTSNKKKDAYVICIGEKNNYPVEKLKSIIRIQEKKIGAKEKSIELALWMKENYGGTFISCLKCVLPVKKVVNAKQKKTIIRRMGREEIQSLYAEAMHKKYKAKERILRELLEEESLPYELVVSKLHVSDKTLESLEGDGVIKIDIENTYRNPVKEYERRFDEKILSKEQETAVNTILEDFDKDITELPNKGRYLLHGITGSGKTEVYIRVIEGCIKRGKQCIMLIPEIALTYQTLLRFYKHFGDRVSVINSGLSQGERYDQCLRAQNGDIDVIIGPRSALFVPFKKLGLVIIDEEHEMSYQSEKTPRYHAREVAQKLCEINSAYLLLGSATPSLESYHRAMKGEYRLLKLTKRLTGGELPKVYIEDLREELRKGNRSVFSDRLREKIEDRLIKNEQIMLFLNRRGVSGFISCRACGEVVKCPHCDVSLSRHRGGILMCHYCGYTTEDVKKCPKCGSSYISGFKAGTQQVEEAINKLFPKARVLRMDSDTTKTKDSYEKILSAFAENEADILLGTQMIVKGHDFPRVTLVGIIAADISLNESDFRSSERTFQILTQAVGRAGRGERLGEAVIQTYRTDHYSIEYAARQDYEGFYKEEIAYRMIGDYPPAKSMLKIQVQSKEDRRALGLATALAKRVEKPVRCIGPSKDVISKINDFYRYNLYLKASCEEEIIRARSVLEDYLLTAPLLTEFVTFDVN